MAEQNSISERHTVHDAEFDRGEHHGQAVEGDDLIGRNHIFVSYARRDRAYVGRLGRFLDNRGFDPWIDLAEPRHVGQLLSTTVEQAIETCGAVILVISPFSLESDWVKQEVRWADRHQRVVYPLLIQGSGDFTVPGRGDHGVPTGTSIVSAPGLGATEYEDVRDGQDPSEEFVALVRRALRAADPLQWIEIPGDAVLAIYRTAAGIDLGTKPVKRQIDERIVVSGDGRVAATIVKNTVHVAWINRVDATLERWSACVDGLNGDAHAVAVAWTGHATAQVILTDSDATYKCSVEDGTAGSPEIVEQCPIRRALVVRGLVWRLHNGVLEAPNAAKGWPPPHGILDFDVAGTPGSEVAAFVIGDRAERALQVLDGICGNPVVREASVLPATASAVRLSRPTYLGGKPRYAQVDGMSLHALKADIES